MTRRFATASEAPQVIQPPKPPLALYWEYDGVSTPGFVVEESTDLTNFVVVGSVAITNIWRTNVANPWGDGLDQYTYRWEILSNHPAAFYRVGATLP